MKETTMVPKIKSSTGNVAQPDRMTWNNSGDRTLSEPTQQKDKLHKASVSITNSISVVASDQQQNGHHHHHQSHQKHPKSSNMTGHSFDRDQDLSTNGKSDRNSASTPSYYLKPKPKGAKQHVKKKSGPKSSKGSKSVDEESGPTELYGNASDEAIDQFFDFHQKSDSGPKIIRRSSGFFVLDSQFRIGPDVIDGDLECTPLPHYMSPDHIQNFSQMLNKISDELIPRTPKDTTEEFSLTTFDIRMYQQQSRSPAMSWNASLITLEEEEFADEIQLFESYKTIHNLPAEDGTDKADLQKIINITNVDGTVSTKRRIKIVLTECETTFLLQLAGKYELESVENYEDVTKRNERYKTMVQHHLESDAYSNHFAQTFENRSRDQWTEYKSPAACDVAVQANFYMIEDEYKEVAEADAKRKIREEEEAQIKVLQERLKVERDAIEAIHNSDEDYSDEEDKEPFLNTIDWGKYGGKYDDDDEEDDAHKDLLAEREFDLSENEDEFETNIPLSEIYERQQKKNEQATLTVLPDISMGVVFMDRLISMEYMQDNQADMRGYPILNANLDANDKKDSKPHFFNLIEENRGKGQAQLDLGPNIRRYWSLRSTVTKGREVTDIALHNLNGNIVAASYGSYRFGDDEDGMVCIWSAKNTFYPERIYEFKASVTCLAFANLTPYLLAVGMLDGNLAVYDVRSSISTPISSTFGSQDKHEGAIWQVCWFQETDVGPLVNEILLSLGDDGRLNRWTSTKGFDSVTMLRVRRSPLRIPGRREKRAEALTSNLSVAFSLCFYPNDWTQYLIGTEEGFIHKCSTSFTEQFVATYIGHSGPVYRITFNSFDKTIFVSASADWSVKVWRDGTLAPLLSMQTGLRTMFDVTCCPTMSSVFVCASEFHVEVWDLTLNTLEPVVQFAPPFAVAFRRAAYSSYLNSVILGDDEGAITFYGLRDFPPQSSIEQDQIDQLLEGLLPAYKKRSGREMEDEKQMEHFLAIDSAAAAGTEGERLAITPGPGGDGPASGRATGVGPSDHSQNDELAKLISVDHPTLSDNDKQRMSLTSGSVG